MSPVFVARRRAEEFDALVEDISTGPVDPARYAELLTLVGALRDTPQPEPRPAYVADLRERLMTAAATELVPTTVVQDRLTLTRRSPRERRLAVAVGGFAIIGATTSMAVAAQSALPGDVLYPLKRAIENAHTGLSVDDEQKGSTLLANASGRLDEVDRLAHATDAEEVDVAAIEETLATFTAQATEASDLLLAAYAADGDDQAIADLQDFTAQSFEALNQLAATVTDPVRDALVPVGQTLAAIEAAVQQACPACADVLTSIPPWMLASADNLGSGLADLLASTDEIVTAVVPGPDKDQGKGAGQGKGSGQGSGQGQVEPSEQPATGQGNQPPASEGPGVQVPSNPAHGGGSGGGTLPEQGSNAVDDLLGGLLGGAGGSGGGATTPTQAPELPIVGPLVNGLGQVVEDLTNPLQP